MHRSIGDFRSITLKTKMQATQSDVAKACGVSPSALSMWLRQHNLRQPAVIEAGKQAVQWYHSSNGGVSVGGEDSEVPHACRAATAKSAMSIALPTADVREDELLGHGSHGSHRAVALEQLALRLDHLCGLQASRRGIE